MSVRLTADWNPVTDANPRARQYVLGSSFSQKSRAAPPQRSSVSDPSEPTSAELVPDDVIPHRTLPPLRYRDMPEPIAWQRMVGPSIMLAGLSLGSGEFILWPYIVYKSGFIFFWACLVGVCTQFFVNMEIERWTLLTGESTITGFCRLSRHWAWVMLLLGTIPWVWPGWATGAATICSWMLFDPVEVVANGVTTYQARYVPYLAIASLWMVGIILTLGPVVYNTVEKVQLWLVALIFVIAVFIGCLVIRPDAVFAMASNSLHVGTMPGQIGKLSFMELLGAIAFAGAGGTMNLGQSNFIKEKGYGMGHYIGRITSPLTGQPEAVHEIGYHFPHTPANLQRWRQWWRAANVEHFFSFFVTCIACLMLLALISYSLFYAPDGQLHPETASLGDGMNFVWGEALLLQSRFGAMVKYLFLVMGIAILLTTEFGILDATTRIATDIVKVNFVRENAGWPASRIYFLILWSMIAIGTVILALGAYLPKFQQPLFLLTTSAAMNGGVMFLYSLILLYMNAKILPRSLALNPVRFVVMVWACAFFGYFSIQAVKLEVVPFLSKSLGFTP